MNAGQLEELLAIANRGAFLAPSDASAGFAARAAAASDLAAMRQPITAEALLADGWKFEAHEEAYAKHTATGRVARPAMPRTRRTHGH